MSAHLRTLGGLSLQSADAPVTGRVTQRKRLALLALLAATRNGGLSRDKIIGYLWPEGEEDTSRHALSQALYALRRELGDGCIVAGIDELRLNPEVVSSDVAQLNAALATRDVARIAALYTGPFLDGFFLPDNAAFEEWTAGRRAEYERAYTEALDQLAADALAGGQPQRAAAWLQARAAVDPLNSDVALRLMRALAAGGDRAGALRHFRTHAALLRTELALEPGAELSAFAEECARSVPPPRGPSAAPEAAPAEISLSPVPAAARRRPSRRVVLVGGTLLVFGGALALLAQRGNGRESHVLLAAVSGPDSSLSLAVREALRAELEGSERVRVLSDVVASRTLELMRLPPGTLVDEARGLEVAQRRGVPFVITASVQPVGSGVQIVSRMIDASTERVVATATERPNREEDVLAAVARIAERMREGVGRAPERTASPLPAITTSSLQALRNYALARQALVRWDRQRALELVEAALVHDSSFALGHYLAGDLLWYIDKQRHSDEHMARAYQLADRLPPRERLIVQARYEQLVRDEPDSALVFWKLLVNSYPDEPLGYEGLRWAYRALGRIPEMADASERGAAYDGAQRLNHVWDRIVERVEAGDSLGALRMSRPDGDTRLGMPVSRTHFIWQLRWSAQPGRGVERELSPYDRHLTALINGRTAAARIELDSLRSSSMQFYPRALLAQARMEWELARADTARVLLAEVVRWIENADVSAPAYARLAERTSELAAQMGERAAIERMRVLIERQDRGRGLRSYRIARSTLAAADAYARGDYPAAVRASARDRLELYYARSAATALLLRADALARSGRGGQAQRVYQRLALQDGFADLDSDTRALVAAIARRRLGVGSGFHLPE